MVNQKSYTKHVYGNGRHYTYTYSYVYSMNIEDPFIKPKNIKTWCRTTKKLRHVYFEDISLRTCDIIDPSVVSKAGRPKGSKDSYKRTRRKKN